jgi:hypothetical protein
MWARKSLKPSYERGNPVGAAIPSPANANFYFLNFISWARLDHVPFFYFEAFDESWKAQDEGPQGACWGVWEKHGVLKPGMQDVFDGERTIELTYVPLLGSFDDLQGRVWQVQPADYRVAVYIQVRGGWWTKPSFEAPLTDIRFNGGWTCDITSGGADQEATMMAAYLVPNGYTPPLMSGGSTLPAELDENAVATTRVNRIGLETFVMGFYGYVLDRTPSTFEVSTWVNYLIAKPTLGGPSAMVHAFFDGPEFLSRPVTLWDYVTALYQSVLGRWPEAEEVTP